MTKVLSNIKSFNQVRRLSCLIILGIVLFNSCKSPTVVQAPSDRQRVDLRPDQDEELKRIGELETHIEQDPNDFQKVLELATLYLDNGFNKKAKPLLIRLADAPETIDNRVFSSLSMIYEEERDFENALVHLERFSDSIPEDHPSINKVRDKIDHLKFKVEVLNRPFNITLQPLSGIINSAESEYLPQFTADEQNIFFTRRWFGQEDLFEASYLDGKLVVEPIKDLNTRLNEGAHTISADGRTLIFTHCNEKYGFGSCDLYITKKTTDGWERPANMGSKINSRFWDSQPSLSADGRMLYFASTRSGGLGGSDIWISSRNSDGTWSIPVNAGSRINTRSREESPFIHADGSTLYFRSNGHRGLGGFDIFVSSSVNNQWTDPKHLGSPINSTENDGALIVSLDGLRGYFATDAFEGGAKDHIDIFEFSLPEDFRPKPMTYLKGRIIGYNKLPLQASITVHDLDNDQTVARAVCNYNGEFLMAVPVKNRLAIHAEMAGYSFYSDNLSFQEIKHGVNPYFEEIILQEIEPSDKTGSFEPIILTNLFFRSGSHELLPESDTELDFLTDLLNKHKGIKIRISGHTDDVGSVEDNQLLSERRASSVKQALIERNIEADRVEVRGYGESVPIATNQTPEGRRQNRRVEFVIIE